MNEGLRKPTQKILDRWCESSTTDDCQCLNETDGIAVKKSENWRQTRLQSLEFVMSGRKKALEDV